MIFLLQGLDLGLEMHYRVMHFIISNQYVHLSCFWF